MTEDQKIRIAVTTFIFSAWINRPNSISLNLCEHNALSCCRLANIICDYFTKPNPEEKL